jgi:hypothetical protein
MRRPVVVFVRNDVVPHVAAHEAHQRSLEFSDVTRKGLLQQYLPSADMAARLRNVRFPAIALDVGPDRDEPLQENRSTVCRWLSMDKSDAARSPVPPHHMAARCRFEAIRRQIKIGREDVKRAVKLSSLIVDISDHTEVNAGNAIKVKHRGLVDFNAL